MDCPPGITGSNNHYVDSVSSMSFKSLDEAWTWYIERKDLLLPDGFVEVPSRSKPGNLTFLDQKTGKRYATKKAAWNGYRERDLFAANSHPVGAPCKLPTPTVIQAHSYHKESLGTFEWIRAPELINGNAELFGDLTNLQIVQGKRAGNCWFIAGLIVLAEYPHMINTPLALLPLRGALYGLCCLKRLLRSTLALMKN
jgi:hypothetical protein